jgi:predicted secreted hydrolase
VIIDIKKIDYQIVFKMIILVFVVACNARETDTDNRTYELAASSRLSELLGSAGAEGYAMAIEPYAFRFPADHGPHPAYRNEWWYFTGNLHAEDGERFGFELTIFRFSVSPDDRKTIASQWQTNQVYVAHFALTDVENRDFHVAQRYSRGSVGLAGATADPFRVWLGDWQISAIDALPAGQSVWRLRAADQVISLDLRLRAEKPVVLNGDQGLSQKSADIGNASYYYSIPRLRAEGRLIVGDETFAVSGTTWLDREWGSSALSDEQRGWDWFALQLSDGSDLMFYVLRRNDGSRDPHSAGTWIDEQGIPSHLANDDVEIEVTEYWDSELGGRYPSAWRVAVPSKRLALSVRPVLRNQELATNVRYWEGAVDIEGRRAGQRISGRGYVELTGYAQD